jgi:8-oxo-dGTP diphosphatase
MKKGTDCIGISVCYVCHDGAGNYLFQKRSENCRDERGRWDTGGGALEFGETVEEALRKELMEEYGVTPLETEFLGFRDVFREQDGVPTHWLALNFRVRVDRDRAHNAEPHKFDEIGWFPLTAVPQPLHSQLPAFFEVFGGRL